MTGPRIITSETKAEMKRVLHDIQSSKFTSERMQEIKADGSRFKATRRLADEHQIEAVGAKPRDMMPWIKSGALVDKAKKLEQKSGGCGPRFPVMQIILITGIEIKLMTGTWPLLVDMRAAVAEHWTVAVAANPHLWDSRVLELSRVGDGQMVDAADVLSAEAYEGAYSILMAWRSRGFSDIGMCHAFGWALIVRPGWDADLRRYGRPHGQCRARLSAEKHVGIAWRSAGWPDRLFALYRMCTDRGYRSVTCRCPYWRDFCSGGRTVFVGRTRVYFAQLAAELAACIRANLERQTDQELADVMIIRSRADAERIGAALYAVALTEAY